jgi:Flp pilus assembly protein TadG
MSAQRVPRSSAKDPHAGAAATCRARRSGHILVILALLVPMLIGVMGLVFDGGLMMHDARQLQHIVDAAATAAATDLRLERSVADAASTATSEIHTANAHPDAVVAVHSPPVAGEFAGMQGYVEVEAEITHRPRFMPLLDGLLERTLTARAVAGSADVTDGAAVVVLDPDPADVSIPPLPALPLVLPSILAGLEIEGLGRFSVDGSVLVNTTWGGVDENGDAVGSAAAPPYAVTCMPLLPLTRVRARQLRVVGGVDSPGNYQDYGSDGVSPLQANRLAVPDPYEGLPPPLVGNDAANVDPTLRGGVIVTGLPILGPPVTLRPGIYEYITVRTGVANFEPGIYIIRGIDPVTQSSLSLLTGSVNAHGVLFYITNHATYNGVSSPPDASDGESVPAVPGTNQLMPSVVLQSSLLGSGITGLNDAMSPFDGMVIYQRRADRRPIVIAHQNLLGTAQFGGTVFAKWAHVIFAGNGVYDARFVCGTLRVVTVFDTTLEPSQLLPPAQDVLLVE